jgi:dethiobiotin synthetase
LNFPRGIFVTGTDTDIGKTVATAAVLVFLQNSGIDAVPMKPIQSGGIYRGEGMVSPDLEFSTQMAALSPDAEERGHMAPYLFEPACSPHLAAAKAGIEISLDRIADSFAWLCERHQCVVVEGAGGVMVPIAGEKTMLDLMVLLGVPVILVSRPGLGTINHTLLSLRELHRAGLKVLGVLFCETKAAPWGEIEEDNRGTIERIGKARILGRIPYMEGIGGAKESIEAFRRMAATSLHLG